MTTELTRKERSLHFQQVVKMQHFIRFFAKFPLLLILFLYSIQCEQRTYKWKSLSPDLPYEYIFSTDYKETRDWYDSRRWCNENGGGDLLTIKSQLEARTINTELKKPQSTLKALWIGLQDLNNDGTWTWFDGNEFDVNITKEAGILFHPITVGPPRLCVFLQIWSWLLLPGMTNTPMLRTSYCPVQMSFICKRNTTSATQNPIVSRNWKDYLPSDFSRNFPNFCPTGFIDLPKKCVRVEQNATTSLTWNQAGSFCRDKYGNQSYLLSFHDDDEVLDLSVHLPFEKTEYWIGFSRLGQRNHFWYDNTKVNNISWFTFDQGKQYMYQPCGYMVHDLQSVRFVTGHCFLKKNFMCQINKSTAVSSSVNIVSEDFMNVTHCPAGFSFATTESCYKVISEKMDFKRAELFCNKQNGSHLTSVESNTEDILLQRIAEYNNVTQFWLGLQLQENPQLLDIGKPLLYWNDGYPVFYNRWLNVHDSNAVNKSKLCVTHERATQWVTSSCVETYPFICKIKLDRSDQPVNKEDRTFCPSHWVPFGSHCYLFTANMQLTWREAAEECIHFNMNSTLTSITSDLEAQFIKYIVPGDVQGGGGVWTGVYLNRNNIPTSIDGTTFSLAAHEHSSEFPGKCGMLTPRDQQQNIQWTDCKQKNSYVCKMKKIKQKDFLTTNVTSAGCPSNEWVRFDDHCYLFLPDQFLTWAHAQQLCSDKSDLNANLVSIHSLKENHFVQKTLHDRTKLPFHGWSWIGYYTDRDSFDSNYVWQWTDKTSLDYHNWKISSWSPPTSHKQERFCVAMDTTTGIWATKPCTDLHGAVCKIPFSKVSSGSGAETTSDSFSTSDSSHIADRSSQDTALETITTVIQTNTIRAEGQTAENYTQNKGRKSSFPAISVMITIGISLLILILIFIIGVLLFRDRLSRSLIFCCKRSATGTSLPENSEYINTDELRNFDDARL